MQKIFNELKNHGILGAVIAGLFSYIIAQDLSFQEERERFFSVLHEDRAEVVLLLKEGHEIQRGLLVTLEGVKARLR